VEVKEQRAGIDDGEIDEN